jgi:hypothetical protein
LVITQPPIDKCSSGLPMQSSARNPSDAARSLRQT